MGDAEGALPPSKKRAAGREISRDNPGLDDEKDVSEQETGTFKRASDEVLANRRIVKVRRKETTSTPSSNPFAGIRLVPLTETQATPAEPSVTSTDVTAEADNDEKTLSEDGKRDVSENEENENTKQSGSKTDEPVDESEKSGNENEKQVESKVDEPPCETVAEKENAEDKKSGAANEATENEANSEKPAAGDQTQNEDKKQNDKADNEEKKDSTCENVNSAAEGASLSSFHQLSSSQNAFTGLAGTGFPSSTFSFGSVQPSFGFGLSTNGNSSLFNSSGSSIGSKSEGSGFPSMQEVPIETGEENERVAFSADSVLFEFMDGGWKERGKGELKVNVSTAGTERARLLMRARGNYRLILNASLYPDMKLTNMDKKGITFACMNGIGEGKEGLSTFALKFKDVSIVEEFRVAVMAHKGKTGGALKTPENSPKASEV
ncbi:hypothetical protein SLE2022_311140 [Rubroshorea leprosula]